MCVFELCQPSARFSNRQIFLEPSIRRERERETSLCRLFCRPTLQVSSILTKESCRDSLNKLEFGKESSLANDKVL